MRQLDRVSRELLARAWAAGTGPGDGPLTIDLDSTVCETSGLKKEDALHGTYTHVRGYHPLLAVTAGTGDVQGREGRSSGAIALKADATSAPSIGRARSTASDTRALVLYHVEGGEEAFRRRQQKYAL